jgi:hypothetical protein
MFSRCLIPIVTTSREGHRIGDKRRRRSTRPFLDYPLTDETITGDLT